MKILTFLSFFIAYSFQAKGQDTLSKVHSPKNDFKSLLINGPNNAKKQKDTLVINYHMLQDKSSQIRKNMESKSQEMRVNRGRDSIYVTKPGIVVLRDSTRILKGRKR